MFDVDRLVGTQRDEFASINSSLWAVFDLDANEVGNEAMVSRNHECIRRHPRERALRIIQNLHSLIASVGQGSNHAEVINTFDSGGPCVGCG